MLRPRFDAAEVTGHLEEMFAALTAAGARVATMTFPDVGKIAPLARPVRGRVFELNAQIRAAAARHERIAAAVAQALHLPGSDDAWTRPLPAQQVPSRWQAAAAEARWAAAFLGPWLGRRLRGRSSGDGRTAKRPRLQPLRVTPGSPADTGQEQLT